jgi:hypothetical protein
MIIISVILFLNYSCKNTIKKDSQKVVTVDTTVQASNILVAKDIISEVIVKPDTTGDPWESEKVKNYDGKLMFNDLFEKIYSKKIVVYDILSGKPMDPSEVKKLEIDFGSDISKIAKFQFLEDWYFDTLSNKLVKKLKSVSFGYTVQREAGLPAGYKAFFRLNFDQ